MTGKVEAPEKNRGHLGPCSKANECNAESPEELRQAAGSAKNEVRKESSELSEAEDMDTGFLRQQ